MWHRPENDHFVDELLLAGQRAQPGLYKEIGTGRVIHCCDASEQRRDE